MPTSSPHKHQPPVLSLCSVTAALVLSASGCKSPPVHHSFPPPSDLPAQATLPDPLIAMDGKKVGSRKKWRSQRRPELQAQFQHYMYGNLPPAPAHFQARILGTDPAFLDGRATLKLVCLETGPEGAPRIDLMLVIPNQRLSPAPVFLAINFCGNQALTADPQVPLTHSWVPPHCPGSTNNAATDAARGTELSKWPLEEIVRRGYALAAFYHGDIDPDRADASTGIYAWLAHGDQARNPPADRGSIAAWAWGFHRCVDYLEADPDIDPGRIAAVGHSRNGKAALLAAAFDERIAVAFPHQAGCGGSAPSRGKVGESVKAINDRFPHWFNAHFKQFNLAPDRLPFDQNGLVALCAPRPVLFTAAEKDQWSNPAGQFDVLVAADHIYRFLGVDGLSTKRMPPVGQLVDSRLGYWIRPGEHSMTHEDWRIFLAFADKHLKPKR